MLKELIAKVVERQDLTSEEAEQAMNEIMEGRTTDSQIASFLTALRMKGETVDEIAGCARAMRNKVTRIKARDGILVDTCGTGGDGANTFNISTTAAFVAAGAGLTVAKHGNRSVSSKSGSADVLEALGINLSLSPNLVEECLDTVGIGFLFAPLLHKAMKYAVGPRREMGIRTVFNILGPLTNPAGAQAQVVGVYRPELTEILGNALCSLGTVHSFVVHGMDGLDEFSISDATKVTEISGGTIRTYYVTPEEAGLPRADSEAIKGGTAAENARATLEVLRGARGPKRDVVLLNASAALVAGGLAGGLHEGINLAANSIDSGKALGKLEMMREFTMKAVPVTSGDSEGASR